MCCKTSVCCLTGFINLDIETRLREYDVLLRFIIGDHNINEVFFTENAKFGTEIPRCIATAKYGFQKLSKTLKKINIS